MFAAAQKKQDTLELFELALGLLSEPTGVVPETLNTYMMEVIEQAKRMYTDARSSARDVLPEAITLAVYMKRNPDLGRDIAAITDLSSIDATVAKRLLGSLGYNVSN